MNNLIQIPRKWFIQLKFAVSFKSNFLQNVLVLFIVINVNASSYASYFNIKLVFLDAPQNRNIRLTEMLSYLFMTNIATFLHNQWRIQSSKCTRSSASTSHVRQLLINKFMNK